MTTDLAPWFDADLVLRVLGPAGLLPGAHLSPKDEAALLDADSKVSSTFRWARADLALQYNNPEDDKRIADASGVALATVRQDKWVAKAYPYAYRVGGVSFEHHKALLLYPFDVVDIMTRHEYLLMAEAEGMSVGAMLAWLRDEMIHTVKTRTVGPSAERWFRSEYGLNVTTYRDSIQFRNGSTTLVARFNGEGIEWETIHESMER